MSTTIMSTNAVAFLLLNKFRGGATMSQLTDALTALKEELAFAGRDVGFSGDVENVVSYVVS